MAYIFLDESGDLGFSPHKGSSKFFTITIIFAEKKRPLEKIARKTHKGLRKKFKKVGVLHAYNEQPVTRERVLKQLAKSDCDILVIVLNKEKIYTKLQNEKAVLYNYVTNILLDRLITKKPIDTDKSITLVAARRETNKFLNENFKNYLSNQLANNHTIPIKIEISTPHQEKALQIADFASWAIFRKYELGDETYYNLIKSKIIEESPLFP